MMYSYLIEEKEIENLYKKFDPYMSKIEGYCKKNHIDVCFDVGNVKFSRENKSFKISYAYLFRQSGIKSVHREKGENMVEMVDVTDEMFYENYVKATINLFFK